MKQKKNTNKPTQDIANSQPKQIGSLNDLPQLGSESVKVILRVRPLNNSEINRGDNFCLSFLDKKSCYITHKGLSKQYQFNSIIDHKTNQQQMFINTQTSELINSALDGYAATIFAYGQTGSGKTYTMAGVEQKLGRQTYIRDETEGIIPRSINFLWSVMDKREQKFYVKASFTQIYNQQIHDLLNPNSGILHCRWNSESGFFVQDLVVVDCTTINDMIAVLHQGFQHLLGTRNRKIGSHQLNKDSSRSHSIMTVYLISEIQTSEQKIKKYGKISFVDLAGNQRLKQTKSQGQMVKQTGNINKSLFTLGKVIKSLSDKKNKINYIPYRDSKLTMLLMDSLGGTAKALMIACIGPSAVYAQQSINTLNYASRTMNIKNKPVIQIEHKDQLILDLIRERDLLKLQNEYLQEQLSKLNLNSTADVNKKQKNISMKNSKSTKKDKKINQQRHQQKNVLNKASEIPINKLIQQYQFQIQRLRKQSIQLKNARQIIERHHYIVTNDNNALKIRLENLEDLFMNHKGPLGKQYMEKNLTQQNIELKKKIQQYQFKNLQLDQKIRKKISQDPKTLQTQIKIKQEKVINKNLLERFEFLKKRERDLLETLKTKN